MSKITTYSYKLNDWAIKDGQLISVYYNLVILFIIANFYLLPKHTYNKIQSTFCSISNKNISSMNMNKKSVLIRWKWMIKNQDPTVKIAWSSCAYAYICYNVPTLI